MSGVMASRRLRRSTNGNVGGGIGRRKRTTSISIRSSKRIVVGVSSLLLLTLSPGAVADARNSMVRPKADDAVVVGLIDGVSIRLAEKGADDSRGGGRSGGADEIIQPFAARASWDTSRTEESIPVRMLRLLILLIQCISASVGVVRP